MALLLDKSMNIVQQRNKGNKMSVEYKQGWKWIVWVGGVDDYYVDYNTAKKHYDEWLEKGYDQVQIVEITK